MTNDKVKVSAYLPLKVKTLLQDIFIAQIKKGDKKSYGDIIGDALVRVHGKEIDG